MSRIEARLQYTKFLYAFKVTVDQIVLDLTLFLDNSYNFHKIWLKHGEQLDYEVMQHILFRG